MSPDSSGNHSGADTRSVSVHGHHVRVRVRGQGEPLLLLNGATRPLESWDAFAAAVPGRRLVCFDVPGVGLSPTPLLPLTIPVLAKVSLGVLAAVDVEGPADVLGFSFGGAVAQQLALQSPDRVRRLVLLNTSCGVGATPGSRDALSAVGRPPGAPWPLPDPVGAMWHLLALSCWSSIPFLGALRAPTLVVAGTRDRVVPPSNSRVLARRIPGARLVELPRVGHDVQRDRAVVEVAGAVRRFLDPPDPGTRNGRATPQSAQAAPAPQTAQAAQAAQAAQGPQAPRREKVGPR